MLRVERPRVSDAGVPALHGVSFNVEGVDCPHSGGQRGGKIHHQKESQNRQPHDL